MADRGRNTQLTDVIFEFVAVGNAVRVCAVDPETDQEITIVGPATAGEAALRRTALAKLRYALDKNCPEPLPRSGHYV